MHLQLDALLEDLLLPLLALLRFISSRDVATTHLLVQQNFALQLVSREVRQTQSTLRAAMKVVEHDRPRHFLVLPLEQVALRVFKDREALLEVFLLVFEHLWTLLAELRQRVEEQARGRLRAQFTLELGRRHLRADHLC